MDSNYYYSQLEQLNEVVKESADKKISFYQHVILVSSSILGIIISLHTITSPCIYVRLTFVLSVISLLIGILSMVVVLYDFSHLPERIRPVFQNEIEKSLKKDEKVNPVFVKHKRRTLILEKISYLFLLLGMALLVTYNVLISL
ncbi:hypothetical protein [Gaoshiqia sp. Z1-71]|uniref:hypothetical protein n=1 Tax=Gaoshiqia hydrogeniformans TaxID=3290090 RepID=UPI003BF7847B